MNERKFEIRVSNTVAKSIEKMALAREITVSSWMRDAFASQILRDSSRMIAANAGALCGCRATFSGINTGKCKLHGATANKATQKASK